jgi:hypothetical protein
MPTNLAKSSDVVHFGVSLTAIAFYNFISPLQDQNLYNRLYDQAGNTLKPTASTVESTVCFQRCAFRDLQLK